ncbi:MAG: hypothetical protein HGA76_10740, partial [Candidatus Firestonebacteria bacterium]|nr:hypothetical protein [Candidatus Firestonebacteria bacterium]
MRLTDIRWVNDREVIDWEKVTDLLQTAHWSKGITREEVEIGARNSAVAVAASAERGSEHPLGEAIVRAAQAQGLTLSEPALLGTRKSVGTLRIEYGLEETHSAMDVRILLVLLASLLFSAMVAHAQTDPGIPLPNSAERVKPLGHWPNGACYAACAMGDTVLVINGAALEVVDF